MAHRSTGCSSLRSLGDLVASEEFFLGVGAWHRPPSQYVLKTDDVPFGGDKRGVRPIVICEVIGPNVCVYARSTTSREGILHQAHKHSGFTCKIDADNSRVVTKVPTRVARDRLSRDTYSCIEPEGTELDRYLDRWRN